MTDENAQHKSKGLIVWATFVKVISVRGTQGVNGRHQHVIEIVLSEREQLSRAEPASAALPLAVVELIGSSNKLERSDTRWNLSA
jgi:hypothetical protein